MDDHSDEPEDVRLARRAFLRAAVYTAPVVLTVVKVESAQAQNRVSCGPIACQPRDNCGPARCPPVTGCPPVR